MFDRVEKENNNAIGDIVPFYRDNTIGHTEQLSGLRLPGLYRDFVDLE